jgi:ferredoxin
VGCGICEYACPLEPAAIVVSQHSRQERSGRDTRVPG